MFIFLKILSKRFLPYLTDVVCAFRDIDFRRIKTKASDVVFMSE